MNIIFRTIPHNEQRYETCGDWWWIKDDLHIRVSKMSDWRYEALVLVHELVEVFLCKHSGIKEEAIHDFDIEFEKRRAKSLIPNYSEPGDNRFAPYEKEHCLATGVERILAAF